MTAVCLIGDSHLGALKSGIDAHDLVRVNLHPTYFGVPLDLGPYLQLRGRALVADDPRLEEELARFSGGRCSVEIDAYDEFVVIGHKLWVGDVAWLYRDYCSDSMHSPAGERYLLSDDCFVASAQQQVTACQAIHIAELIRSVTDRPITVVSAPNPGVGLSETEMPHWFPPFHLAERNGDADVLGELFREVCNRISASHKMKIVPPLADVALNGLFNRREFCLLPENLEANPSLDRFGAMVHGNSLYGSVLVRHLFGNTSEAE
jgi:hypothetical protein